MSQNFIKYLLLFLLLIIFLDACNKNEVNPVLNFLKNSDLKFDNKIQRDNLMQAFRDIIMLSTDDLIKVRYKDYDGNENRWDLQTLFTKHFVPKKQGLTWGDHFYKDVKTDSVKAIISKFLITY